MKKSSRFAVCAMLLALLFAVAAPHIFAEGTNGTLIYGNSDDDRCFYERMVQLPNGDLLATWQREFPLVTDWSGMKSFYFYKSSDQGKTWTFLSELDPSDHPGLSRDKMGMPGLFVLPQQMGEYPAGTILFATSDWDINAEYCVHIWRSTDNGQTWTLHSSLAPRGEDTVSGTASVWEPEFIVSSDGHLVCFYSDERQPGFDQCLAYEVSTDGGVTWDGYTIIAGEYDEDWRRGIDPSLWRPGMPRVLKLKDGTYFMAYENIAAGHNGIVTCRTSSNGIDWGPVTTVGTPVTAEGTAAYQCPEIAYIDDGSTYGRIFLRGMNDTCSSSQLFASSDKGQTWQLIDAPLTSVRQESVGSGWSGTLVAASNKLIELNNCFNGSFNEIRCGSGTLYGDQLIVDGADYKVVNAASGLCLDDAGGSMDWGNEMILWESNGLETQSWNFANGPDGYTLVCNFSGLALDNPNGSLTAGTRIVQWDKNYSTAQQWRLAPQGDGTFKIQNVASGLYLDTEGSSTQAHAYVVQNHESSSATQTWTLERIFETVRLRSSNINDCHVYHDGAGNVLIANKTTALPYSSSLWRAVPGLADANGVSFESVDQPGYYLRHYEGKLIISQDDGSEIFKQDATWRMSAGLADPDGASFASYNISGTYMRHFNSYLMISPVSTELEKADATFMLAWQ